MTRAIAIISGKGGVGKTTLTSNLASALCLQGEDVVAVDANLTTPNLGLHLGMHFAPITLHDVLKGESKLRDATYPHPFGFKVVPASMSVDDLTGIDPSRLYEVVLNLTGKTNFILLDSAAGLGREATSALQATEEVLIITNPNLPSVADALKTIRLAERLDKKIIGVVANRVRKKEYELTKAEIEEMTGYPVLAQIPEDNNVTKAIFAKMPVVNYSPHSPAAIEFKRLACLLTGKPFLEKPRLHFTLIDRLVNWMMR
ncbi:MAG: cell division ATPase MinD [Candidatus Aenigmatarchaeota archaeon]